MTKSMLVIGAGPGIGVATAARFAREGFSVTLTSRNPGKMAEDAARIEAGGAKVELATLDAADPAKVAGFVAARAGGLDVLLYNAGALRFVDGAMAM